MNKTFVQQYGELENKHWWFVIRQKIILQTIRRYIPNSEAGRLKILNVGAAAGGSSKWLSALGEVVSLENDPFFLNYLEEQNLMVINASVTEIPLADNSFDLVCAFDVIEHVVYDQKALDELLRICKPGGAVCVTVPAFQSIWGNHDVVNGHQRRYLKKQILHLLNNEISTILYSTYFNSILFIPIYLFRKMQQLFKNKQPKQDSDFNYFKTNFLINVLLKFIFGLEVFLLKWINLPFGVSLIFLIRKIAFSKKES